MTGLNTEVEISQQDSQLLDPFMNFQYDEGTSVMRQLLGDLTVNRRQSRLQIVFVVQLAMLSSNCVTVEIGNTKRAAASGVKWEAPSSPFENDTTTTTDQLWRHRVNGNTISYISDCDNALDPDLASIKSSILADLAAPEIISENTTEFNQRAALRVKLKASVDGVPSHVDLLIFKRNSCSYVLTYLGVSEHFKENTRDFESFLKSFAAP